jgi:hypothetical protein
MSFKKKDGSLVGSVIVYWSHDYGTSTCVVTSVDCNYIHVLWLCGKFVDLWSPAVSVFINDSIFDEMIRDHEIYVMHQ